MTGPCGDEDRVQVQSDRVSAGSPSGPRVRSSVSTARKKTAFVTVWSRRIHSDVRVTRGHYYSESSNLKV